MKRIAITSKEAAREALVAEAKRFGVPLDILLHPHHFRTYYRQSKVLKAVVAWFLDKRDLPASD